MKIGKKQKTQIDPRVKVMRKTQKLVDRSIQLDLQFKCLFCMWILYYKLEIFKPHYKCILFVPRTKFTENNMRAMYW